MFLHGIVPEDIRYDLHNQIWTHCANENNRASGSRAMICGICGASPPIQGSDVEAMLANCPLTPLLPPLEKRWGARYKLQQLQAKRQQVMANKASISEAIEPTSLPTPPSTPEQPRPNALIEQIEAARGPTPTVQTPSTSETSLDDTLSVIPAPGSPSSLAATPQTPLTTPISASKTKKLDLRRTSIRFEEVPDDKIAEVQEAGYLLWEFRPMDNTFMEAWGKVDQFPRYKWERPDVMDKDVAVTVEYAKAVLAGKQRHKWSKVEAEDVVMAEVQVSAEHLDEEKQSAHAGDIGSEHEEQFI